MADEMQDLVSQWKTLKTQAESGDLTMDSAIGSALQSHAQTISNSLDALLSASKRLSSIAGFGGLASAGLMKSKFEQKADGGSGSAAERLAQSIDVLTLMAETYEKAIKAVQDVDTANAQNLAGA